MNFSDLKLIASYYAIYDEEGNSLDAARHPLQIVDHPIYPNNMMRKEIS